MEGDYGKGKYCPEGDKGKCLSLTELEQIMGNSRDPEELKRAWLGWHQIAIPIRKDYVRFVELSNKGAKEMGFKDTGAMWRSKYDMAPDEFAREVDRLWEQVKPLYLSLHTYVRGKLHEKYGAAVPENGPIPAHLLGNLWRYDLSVDPPTAMLAAISLSLTPASAASRIWARLSLREACVPPLSKALNWSRSAWLRSTR